MNSDYSDFSSGRFFKGSNEEDFSETAFGAHGFYGFFDFLCIFVVDDGRATMCDEINVDTLYIRSRF